MDAKCCSTCESWQYNRWTEDKYGMGVGICAEDGSPKFCDRIGCICYNGKEQENE